MLIADLTSFLRRVAPPDLGLQGDANGIVLGALKGLERRGVRKVGVSVDVSLEAVLKAAKQRVSFLVVHHGLFKQPGGAVGPACAAQLQLILSNNLTVYCVGSAWEAAEFGISEQVAEALGLSVVDLFTIKEDHRLAPIGRICDWEGGGTATLGDVTKRVKMAFGVNPVRRAGREDLAVGRVCVVPGERLTPAMVERAYAQDCDCVVTGHASRECAVAAQYLKVGLVEATHHALDQVGMRRLSNMIALEFPRDEVTFIPTAGPLDAFEEV